MIVTNRGDSNILLTVFRYSKTNGIAHVSLLLIGLWNEYEYQINVSPWWNITISEHNETISPVYKNYIFSHNSYIYYDIFTHVENVNDII